MGKILLIGSSGQLGRAFLKAYPDAETVPPVRTAGITDTILSVARSTAETVINCTAWTDVSGADRFPNREEVYRLNAELPAKLARMCRETGKRFVTFSTDYVFDGVRGSAYTPEDEPHPLNTYGKSKYDGERAALDAHPGGACIIRTAGLYSFHGKNFVKTVLAKILLGEPFPVRDDLTTNLTNVDWLATNVDLLLTDSFPGVYHVTGTPPLTWYQIAKFIEDAAEKKGLVQTGQAFDGVTRPRFSALSSPYTDDLWAPRLFRTVKDLISGEPRN